MFTSFVRSPDGRRVEFRIHRLPVCVVNAARRAVLAEVATAGFEYDPCRPDAPTTGIHVRSNTSTLHNEFLAHRVSLLPIHLTEDELEGFAADPSKFRFTLREKNKGAAGARVADVTTRHIKVTDAFGVAVPDATRDAMFPPDGLTGDHPLIVCLRPSPVGDGDGEQVSLDAVATCSNGRAHPRWCPTSLCTFRNVVDPALADAAFAAEGAGTGAGTGAGAGAAQSRAQFDTLGAHRCFARDEHGDPVEFHFTLESECGLRPEFIFYRALRILSTRVRAIAASVAASDADTVLQTLPGADDFHALTISGEDHTLGNLLQGLLYDRHVRDDAGRRLQFVGYHLAHPLEHSICVKLKVAPGVVVRDFLVESMRAIAAYVDGIARSWAHPSGLDMAGIRVVDQFLSDVSDVSDGEK